MEPLDLSSIEPARGSVAGGTRVTLVGAGFHAGVAVDVGGVPCDGVTIESSHRLSCLTGPSGFVEAVMDVTVRNDGAEARIPAAFEYHCPWTTTTGRRSCGAAPPRELAQQTIAAWLNEGSGFTADGAGPASVDDRDFIIGERSAWVETDGFGTPRMLRASVAPTDLTGHLVKVWVKVGNVASAAAIELWLGDAGLASAFRFRLQSSQGQQWITDGDWVAFTVSWSSANYSTVGTPNRAAIREIGFRVVDDQTGVPVRLHANGVALVPEPVQRFPAGVLSFTFDDNWAMMAGVGAQTLAQYGYPATAYVIVDHVDKQDRTSLGELHQLQESGWDVAAHAFTSVHHDARLTTLAADVVEDDFVDSRAWLMSNGFGGYDHCAYPGGEFDSATGNILPIAARYFTSCRTIYQRQREAAPPSDPLKLRVLYVTSGVPLAAVTAAVDQARANYEWIILVFHQLVDAPTDLTQWATTDFQQLVDHVAASGIAVDTVTGVLSQD
ncbi:MAG: IPT/TIG domain-containing protein [Deltaproteobacteria bacterium]|nr:IPT/TIG domain-containing protein [Deltaproteobacteria bacterium]